MLTITMAGSDPNYSSNSVVNHKISSSKVCSQDSPASCPTWFYCNNTIRCQCYKINYWILCNEKRNLGEIQTGVCLTFNNLSKTTEIGNCLVVWY